MKLLLYLLILLFVLYQRAQAAYYQVSFGINQGTNFVSLNCQTDQFLPYNEAQWLYNGSVYSQSSCFSSAPSSGFTLVSECDGYWQCGNGTEYSNFIPLIAYPRRTPDFTSQTITITKAIGEQVTLPCHVRVSALNDHTVLWRIRTLTTNDLEGDVPPNNPDYSLTLNNLNASNAKTYLCIVRSNTYLSASETGQTIHLHVVNYRIPQIITDIDAELSADNMTIKFVASGRGTNIGFMWFLNRNQLTTNTPGVEIDNSNSLQSILRLQPLAATSSKVQQLDVVVSNTYEVNGTNNDTLTVFLYPAPSLPISTIIHSPSPSIASMPTGGGLSSAEISMYSGIGVGFSVLVLIILILIAIVIALVCYRNHDKHKPPQPVIQQNFQTRDLECADHYFASMIKFLINLDQRPDISYSVKLEIDGLLNKIKKDKTANLERQVRDRRNDPDNDLQVVDSSSASGAIQRRVQADSSAPPPYDEHFFETTFPHSYSALAKHKTMINEDNKEKQYTLTDEHYL